jgi:hypothetical protein
MYPVPKIPSSNNSTWPKTNSGIQMNIPALMQKMHDHMKARTTIN